MICNVERLFVGGGREEAHFSELSRKVAQWLVPICWPLSPGPARREPTDPPLLGNGHYHHNYLPAEPFSDLSVDAHITQFVTAA